MIWKEYLHYLVKNKAVQKLNKVVSNAVQVHPSCLDFWLVGAYVELDMKGNLFSSRNLMLQALRANGENPTFYTAYLEFELAFLAKVMQRRAILQGKEEEKKFDFINDVEEEGEVAPGSAPGTE